MIILDSDAMIEAIDKHSRRGERVLNAMAQTKESMVTTSINLHEVLYGLQRLGRPTHELIRLPIVNFEKQDALLSANLELEAKNRGNTVPRVDAMIASIAINRNAGLLTFDAHLEVFKPFGLKLFTP